MPAPAEVRYPCAEAIGAGNHAGLFRVISQDVTAYCHYKNLLWEQKPLE